MTRKILLGPHETKLLFALEKEGRTMFTFEDGARIIGSSRAAARHVMHRLTRKRRIIRIQRGKYVLAPARAGIEGDWAENPFVIVPHIIDEYYIGFWTAMSHWGMTEQIPLTIFAATTKRKRPLKYGGQTFRFITLSKAKFFGFIEEVIDGQTFRISAREKTIADALVFPRYCGGMSEVTRAMWTSRKDLNWRRVLHTTKQMGVEVALRRLGFILRLLRLEPAISNSLARRRWYGLRFFDPCGPKKALAYSKDFGLILNLTAAKLTSWRR